MSGRKAALVFLLGALVCRPAAGADRFTRGQGIYKEGELAYNAGRFEEAAGKLREAIREDPAEGLSKFRHTGLNREDYLPHYYLGLCLERLGRLAEARAALEESRRQGAIAGRPSLARSLDDKIRRLEAALAPPPPPSPTPASVTLPTPLPAAPTTVPFVPTPAREEPPPTVVAPVLATPRAERASAAPSPVRSGPPATLSASDLVETREGMRFFYLGRYPEAVRRLEPVASRSPLARLFLAYALAGRYVLDGAANADLLARARREAAASGRVSFPEELVSPALRKLVEAPR